MVAKGFIVASVLMLALGIALTAGAQNAKDHDDPVTVVYDATRSADCRIQLQIDDAPWQTTPCPPGSLIAAEEMPRKLAENIPDAIIVGPAGYGTAVETASREAVQALHDALAPVPVTAASCTAHYMTLVGSYDAGAETTTSYELNYQLNSNCSVTRIRDRAKSDPTGAFWYRSCSNGTGSSCYARDIFLSTTYTGYYQVQDSLAGRQYTNQSRAALCCTDYYGYWYLD